MMGSGQPASEHEAVSNMTGREPASWVRWLRLQPRVGLCNQVLGTQVEPNRRFVMYHIVKIRSGWLIHDLKRKCTMLTTPGARPERVPLRPWSCLFRASVGHPHRSGDFARSCCLQHISWVAPIKEPCNDLQPDGNSNHVATWNYQVLEVWRCRGAKVPLCM